MSILGLHRQFRCELSVIGPSTANAICGFLGLQFQVWWYPRRLDGRNISAGNFTPRKLVGKITIAALVVVSYVFSTTHRT